MLDLQDDDQAWNRPSASGLGTADPNFLGFRPVRCNSREDDDLVQSWVTKTGASDLF
jgi:hypothetical protein